MIKDYKKYINGEYVRLTNATLEYMDLYPIVKILGKRTLKTYDQRGQSLYYRLEGIESKTNKIRNFQLNYDEMQFFTVLRKATQKEIDEYELLKNANIYNL